MTSHGWPDLAALPREIASQRELRYEGVVGQTAWHSCGPAAVSTLLTHYFRIELTEAEALRLAKELMEQRGAGPGEPITALDLVLTLEVSGVPAQGFRVSAEALADYFREGGPPVIAHVTRPQSHFLLVVGLLDEGLLLADPSWGESIDPLAAFERHRGFSGVVLVPRPGPLAAEHLRRQQLAALDRAIQRLVHLHRLREGMP